jgi:hypothetical protein
LPLAQRELYGTREWFDSINRRNAVEGYYGSLKDTGRESFRRGVLRVIGAIKTGLFYAFGVACVNLRMASKWDAEHGSTHRIYSKKIGRPRLVGVTQYAEVFTRLGSTAPLRT